MGACRDLPDASRLAKMEEGTDQQTLWASGFGHQLARHTLAATRTPGREPPEALDVIILQL